MKRLILFLLFPFMLSAQYVSNNFNKGAAGPLTLNPGFVFLQASFSQCSTGTNPNCTLGNPEIIPTTSGSTVVLVLITGSSGVTVNSVSGGGGTWNFGSTNCPGCSVSNATHDSINMAYNTGLTAGTVGSSITVSMTGTVSNFFSVLIYEFLPPSGFTMSFDIAGGTTASSCTTCTGKALAVTSTDMILQAVDYASSGSNFALAGPTGWSSPYTNDYQLDGLCFNCTTTSAPTLTFNGSQTYATFLAIAFKSSAGSFNTTPTFSLKNLTGTWGTSTSGTSQTITIPSTTAGDMLVVLVSATAGSSITSMSGGGTWNIRTTGGTGGAGCLKNLAGVQELSCADNLSVSGSTTSITIGVANGGNWGYEIWEIARTSGSFAFDDANVGSGSTSASSEQASAAALTLTGSPDVCFGAIYFAGGASSAGRYPVSGATGNGPYFVGTSATGTMLLNTTDGSAQKYVGPVSSSYPYIGICYK